MNVALTFLQVSLEVQAKLFALVLLYHQQLESRHLSFGRARLGCVDVFYWGRLVKAIWGQKNRQIVSQAIETKLYGLFLSLLFPDPSPSGSSYQPAHSQNCYYTCDLKATCVCDALFGTHRCWCLDGYVGSGHTGKCRSKFTTNRMNKKIRILKYFFAGGGGAVYDRLVDHFLPHKRLVTSLHCNKGG